MGGIRLTRSLPVGVDDSRLPRESLPGLLAIMNLALKEQNRVEKRGKKTKKEKSRMESRSYPSVKLQEEELTERNEDVDLVVEVAHPAIIRQYAAVILANYRLSDLSGGRGSPEINPIDGFIK
ncbi:unnamed protein product [Nippostrongylus brasiliensis]|uniref:Uncharacterized protein n=1 Tax=Nippostrongylus brasiliensis TaxID=27835 RepID=A0A0N4YHC6_NIPBR|nr:unnamed protein product [Nippostrongylus brasiliensis]